MFRHLALTCRSKIICGFQGPLTDSITGLPLSPCNTFLRSVQIGQHPHKMTLVFSWIVIFPSTGSIAQEAGHDYGPLILVASFNSCQNCSAHVHSKRACKVVSSSAPHILQWSISSICLCFRTWRPKEGADVPAKGPSLDYK
jgi:hypothetical protein